MKEEQLRKVLQNRWSKLEDRSNELCAFMQEMEDIDTDDKEVTGTTIYRFMKFEHTLIDQEQTFIDKLLALINSK